ncbi:Caspase domain-containing protein [Trichoderma simmonsii]|uniref:Caspase domain-containing protein n=1 Tax=Trichoderma simmonsii TaxID=1491479 RepID=A0A8G0L3H0_9HYPO|nr:Caspase domain-containing protein [Trichoderma simmonsii]
MLDKWALLIGVDFYFQGHTRGVRFNHLQGCVRDVSRIEEYLKRAHLEKHGVLHIEKLTASYDDDNRNRPMEADEKTWPTYDNIKAKIDYIGSKVRPGDLVHIHYSGHGILRHKLKDTAREEGGDAISGTALAPTDVMNGGAYVSGYQLGVWVRRLVEIHKARVSITLDSCYSGKGFRHGSDGNFTLRTSEDSEFDESWLDSDEKAEMDVLDDNDGAEDDLGSSQRNAKVKRSWLSTPEGCTVLTACQITEQAGEYKFPYQSGKNGILTHWMLEIIDQEHHAQLPTYARIAHHVKSRIKTQMMERSQTPILHGDSFYEFFGDQKLVRIPMSSARLRSGIENKFFSVDVGTAQGVAKGAVYSIYPSTVSFEKGSPRQKPPYSAINFAPPKILIYKVSLFESEGTLIDEGAMPEIMTTDEGSSYLAALVTWALPSEQLQCKFTACLNSDTNTFEIKDNQHKRVARVPAISVIDYRAGGKIARMLKQLARFNALADLDYMYGEPSGSLTAGNYTFELLDRETGKALKPSEGTYEVKDNQQVEVRFVNNSEDKNVHVAIFMFNATWGIQRVYPEEDGQPTAQAMPRDMELTCGLQMCIPRTVHADDPPDIRDRFRAYVYRGDKPPSWDELLLPDIPADAGLVPSVLTMEPKAVEDTGDASRNGKRLPKSKKSHGEWGLLEFWVHTTPLH